MVWFVHSVQQLHVYCNVGILFLEEFILKLFFIVIIDLKNASSCVPSKMFMQTKAVPW